MISFQHETAREITRYSLSIKAFWCPFAQNLTTYPQCLPRTMRCLCVLSLRLPQERLGRQCYYCGHGTTLIQFISMWDEVSWGFSVQPREKAVTTSAKGGSWSRNWGGISPPKEISAVGQQDTSEGGLMTWVQSTTLLSIIIAWLLLLPKPDTGLCWDPQSEDTMIEQPQEQLYNGCGIDGHMELPPSIRQGKADGVIPKDDSVQEFNTHHHEMVQRGTALLVCLHWRVVSCLLHF